MDHKEHNEFVHDLVEASLARYSSVTPRAGLEGRVLANARATQERRNWIVIAGWLAAGAAAAVIAVGVFTLTHRFTTPAAPHSIEVSKAVATSVKVPGHVAGPQERTQSPLRPSVQRASRVPSERALDEPRLAVFPSPQPLTAEEKLMLQYVHTTPPPVLAASAIDQAEIPALETKELGIAPLEGEVDETKTN